VHIIVEASPAGITILRPAEGLDMSNVTAFRDTLQHEVQRAQRGMIVLLADVTFMDSSGLAVLIEGLKWSRHRHLPYILAQLTPAVRMVIELARLEHFFTIAATLEEAATLMTQAS
jgi:anti-sigma B factor antagonist